MDIGIALAQHKSSWEAIHATAKDLSAQLKAQPSSYDSLSIDDLIDDLQRATIRVEALFKLRHTNRALMLAHWDCYKLDMRRARQALAFRLIKTM